MDKEKQLILKEKFPLTFARMYNMPNKVRLSISKVYKRVYYTQRRLGKGKLLAFIVSLKKLINILLFYRERLYVLERPFHCMEAWGISCGDGWYGLIYELAEKLEPLIQKEEPELRFEYSAVQVKEKFGGLCFYVGYATKEMRKAISETEAKSYVTCEECGEVADQDVSYGWILTLCKPCKEDRRRKRESK